MIYTLSPSGSWRKAIGVIEATQAANIAITERNVRIRLAMQKPGANEHELARLEGVSVHYVRQIAVKWCGGYNDKLPEEAVFSPQSVGGVSL
jgi:hypothetical protein